jgi:hypothetical protein
MLTPPPARKSSLKRSSSKNTDKIKEEIKELIQRNEKLYEENQSIKLQLESEIKIKIEV